LKHGDESSIIEPAVCKYSQSGARFTDYSHDSFDCGQVVNARNHRHDEDRESADFRRKCNDEIAERACCATVIAIAGQEIWEVVLFNEGFLSRTSP
jgi:hypothetical protein